MMKFALLRARQRAKYPKKLHTCNVYLTKPMTVPHRLETSGKFEKFHLKLFLRTCRSVRDRIVVKIQLYIVKFVKIAPPPLN